MGSFWPGNEFRPDRLCSNSRWCGSPRARTRGGAISDAAGFPLVEPIRSLCRDGVRAADVPGEPARDRGVPANPTSGCLPHGHPWTGHPHGSGVRERSSRLAGFRRGGDGTDAPGTAALRRDAAGTGPGSGPVRAGRDRDRTEHGAVPVGTVAADASVREAQCPARPAVQNWNLRLSREWPLAFGRIAAAADLLNVTNADLAIQQADLTGLAFNSDRKST